MTRTPVPVDPETEALARSFERCDLDNLDHEGHVRLAWFYLTRDDLVSVLRELPGKLLRYATSKGAPQHYHETITFAFTCLVHERMRRGESRTWEAFRDENPDLLDRGALRRYYPDELLQSAFAREVFVLPTSPAHSDAVRSASP